MLGCKGKENNNKDGGGNLVENQTKKEILKQNWYFFGAINYQMVWNYGYYELHRWARNLDKNPHFQRVLGEVGI